MAAKVPVVENQPTSSIFISKALASSRLAISR
jgi:hypothetical protein